MKEDYLWDKIGDDAEIKKLEFALQNFRYQETAPPALPPGILPLKKETPYKFFRFAAAACLAFGITFLGIWQQFSDNKIEKQIDLAKTDQSSNKTARLPVSIDEKSDSAVSKTTDLLFKSDKTRKQTLDRKVVKVRYAPAPLIAVKAKRDNRNEKIVKPEVRLTKEEKYAYGQLMLALSITSSKLKIVQDKVDGIDETTAVLENAR